MKTSEQNMQLSSYINFNGQCETAFKFYERCLGGKIVSSVTFAETPMGKRVPPEWAGKICHSTIMFGDRPLMGSDAPPGSYGLPKGFSMSLSFADPAEGERIFNSLAENGTVSMPFQKTFWAAGFGMLVDQFGIPWMINCEQAS